MERSLAFYRDLLGVPLEADANDPNWAEARLDGVRFALHLARPGAELETRNTVRFDFRVDDIDAEMERLRAAGVECGAVMREPGARSATERPGRLHSRALRPVRLKEALERRVAAPPPRAHLRPGAVG